MILLIDNYDSFTWNLVQRLGELDPTIELDRDLVVARNDRITPDEAAALDGGLGPSHVVISPGPCTPKEAGVSAAIIERFAGRVPILGVCLGHQCMADMHGLPVTRHPVLMHGKASEVSHDGRGVFDGLSNPFTATRYHSLVVPEAAWPAEPGPGEDGWVVSAWCREDGAGADGPRVIMGLRRVWGEPAWPDGTPRQPLDGVQFHPESFMTIEGPRMLANFLASGTRPRCADPARLAALLAGGV
ncbi:MAG: aminodeoxychorismate/anthranilate synthase component II [Phycisphaeraceae bacterium]|nr:MAG: aminodeoxychorismate/anthranilate synthase component II [Phycisphaeraceae bacterium]